MNGSQFLLNFHTRRYLYLSNFSEKLCLFSGFKILRRKLVDIRKNKLIFFASNHMSRLGSFYWLILQHMYFLAKFVSNASRKKL